MKRYLLGAACAVLLASTAATAAVPDEHSQAPGQSRAAASASVSAVGVVRKVDPAQGKVTLQHEPIESLGWPAMTMAFRVRDAKLLEGLEPGRKVRFAFVQEGSSYVITSIR
ncbi:MAG TPA: copper-binding protein [Usitatibacter sp.]|nr:copper-binding protein [Usitatibacter sp.]